MLLIAACGVLPKRTPPPKTPVTTKPPVSTPVQPVQPVISGVVLVEPGNHEREKNRIKSLLSKSTGDSLPAAEVGYYLDVLQGRLKQKIGNSKGVGIARSNDRIVIVMTGGSGFEATNSQISPGIRQFLAPLSKILVEYRMTLVSIRIRSDNSATKMSNPQLTEQRAQAVAKYLMDAGVSNKRMVVVGAGKSGANSAAGSRERIELQIEPIVRATGG
ncbi:MAG: OmpA family protein [Arenimonas sp.]